MGQNIQHICFIDTPGHNAKEDKDVSLPYLEKADVLLWCIGLDTNGTIPNTDLDLLEDLKLEKTGKKLYIIVTKADIKPIGDIKLILEKITEELKKEGISFEGISAFASIEKREYSFHKKSLLAFLSEQDRKLDTSHKIFGKIEDVFYRYRDALQKEIDDINHILISLKGLRLDRLQASKADLDLSEGIQAIHQRFNKDKL